MPDFQGVRDDYTVMQHWSRGTSVFLMHKSEPTLSGSAAKGSRVTFTGDMSDWRVDGVSLVRLDGGGSSAPDNTPAIRAALQRAIDANDQARVALVAAMKAAN